MIDKHKLIKKIVYGLRHKFFIKREDGSKLHTCSTSWYGDRIDFELRNIRDEYHQNELEDYLINKLKNRKDVFLIKDTYHGPKGMVTLYHIGNWLHPVYNLWLETNKYSDEYKMVTNKTN